MIVLWNFRTNFANAYDLYNKASKFQKSAGAEWINLTVVTGAENGSFQMAAGFKNVQANKLNNSKINTYFSHVFDSEAVGVKKPNPIIFQYALKNSNSKPKESLMIGDSFEADIMGALSVGMQAIHYANFGEKKHDMCLIINKLNTLKDIL